MYNEKAPRDINLNANKADLLTVLKILRVRSVAVNDIGSGISFSPWTLCMLTVGNHQPPSITATSVVWLGNLKGAFNICKALDGKIL